VGGAAGIDMECCLVHQKLQLINVSPLPLIHMSPILLVDDLLVCMQVCFFFFFTLVTGPRRSVSLKLSDTKVRAPQIRARLGYHNTTQVCIAKQREARADPSIDKASHEFDLDLLREVKPETQKPEHLTRNPKLLTLNPKPETLDPSIDKASHEFDLDLLREVTSHARVLEGVAKSQFSLQGSSFQKSSQKPHPNPPNRQSLA